jgi:hypothetical protein
MEERRTAGDRPMVDLMLRERLSMSSARESPAWATRIGVAQE